MTINKLSRMSIAAVGVPQVAGDFNKFDMSANPKFNIGYKVELADGTVYKYSHFGADTGQGLMVSQDLSDSSVTDTDNSVIAPASAVNTNDGTIGSKFIQFTLAGAIAGQYAGGKLVATDDTGEGYTYDIVSSTVTGNPVSGDVRIGIAQPLQVAVDATTDVSILGNQYSDLGPADTTDVSAAGVSCANIVIATAPYGWIQTKGSVGVLTVGSLVLGSGCILGATGALAPKVETDVLAVVAISQVIGDTTGYSIVALQLD